MSDCASHPADIKVMEWFEVTCADCTEVAYAGEDPAVSCLEDVASSLSSGSSSSQGNDTAVVEDGTALATPTPAASSSGATDGSTMG